MTVVLGPTGAYEQRDKLATLQWSGLLLLVLIIVMCGVASDNIIINEY